MNNRRKKSTRTKLCQNFENVEKWNVRAQFTDQVVTSVGYTEVGRETERAKNNIILFFIIYFWAIIEMRIWWQRAASR